MATENQFTYRTVQIVIREWEYAALQAAALLLAERCNAPCTAESVAGVAVSEWLIDQAARRHLQENT